MGKKNPINKKKLYGRFDRNQALHHKLQRLVVAKGSDIPWEEGEMNTTNISGINGWQLMGIVGLALLAVILLSKSIKFGSDVTTPPPTTSQIVPLAEPQRYRVTFSAEDGTEIEVDPADR